MVERPSGTVTFLFTDIEGSTRRWEEDRPDMSAALGGHDAVLRSAIESHGGWLFKHTGDGVVAAFSSPTAAIEAAIAAQRELELPVRMGIATGEAERRGDDYFGPPLNEAARVMGAGHGGQILVASSTAGIAKTADLLDLGEHRLRDISGSQRLFQVRAEGLRGSFPPLRTLDTTLGNLPAQLTSFIGREKEVERLIALLRERRLVTLTGVGGVGKTRLALQVAAELASGYSGGAWLVELAVVGDLDAVSLAIASTLGITPQPGKTMEQSVVDALSGRDILLLLDNCEHVIDAVAGLAHEIVRHCAGVTTLATSREALRVDGEQTWPVPSLDVRDGLLSPAVTLFAERARAVLPSFDPVMSAEAVSEICRRLDGIPLALELAAARVRSMTPVQIRDRLDERFRLLTGGSRRALERHQTLRHAVQWSYDLLGEKERTLLRRTSVFAGGFSLEAAEAVCRAEELDQFDVIDLLDSLVRKSLLDADSSGAHIRYRLLETIRQFAEEQLASAGEAETLRHHHAHYFADAAARNWQLWLSPQQRVATAWFERELANLRVGFRWSLEAADIEVAAQIVIEAGLIGWHAGTFEPASWALEVAGLRRERALSRLPDLLGVAAMNVAVGNLDRALPLAREAIQLLGEPAMKTRWTLPWFWLGMGLANQGLLDEGLAAARDGAARPEDAPLFLSRGLLAAFVGMSGEREAALELSLEGVALASQTGVPAALAYALEIRGDAHSWLGQLDEACASFEEAARICREAGLVTLETLVLRDLAVALVRVGDRRTALPLLLQQLERGRAAGEWLVTRYTLGHVVIALEPLGRPAAAATLSGAVGAAVTAFPVEREHYAAAVARSREALGESEFERVARDGAAMPFVDLVRYAEAELHAAIAELEGTR